MTNILGFQTLKLCEPHGQSDIIVVKTSGNFIAGFSSYFGWIKLQDGPNNYGYTFRAANELDEYNINWEIYDICELDNSCIGKISLCIFAEDLSPFIIELLDVKMINGGKELKIKIYEQNIYNFETDEFMKIKQIDTTITINDNEFKIEPDIVFTKIAMENRTAGNFFENKNTDEYISFKEIIDTKIFGEVKFTIFNDKIFSRINYKNSDIFIELINSVGNINTDNINQLREIMNSYEKLKKYSDEYIVTNYFDDNRINDFFMEVFLDNIKVNNRTNDELNKLLELPIEEKIKGIPFHKLIINYSDKNQYSIMLGIYSRKKITACSSLLFYFDINYCFKQFDMETTK